MTVPRSGSAANKAVAEKSATSRNSTCFKHLAMSTSMSAREDFGEKLRLDIAAAHHGYCCTRALGARGMDLVRMEHSRSRGYGAAGFSKNARRKQQLSHSPLDLVLLHRDDRIHIFADVLKVDGSDALRAQAVGHGARCAFTGDGLNLARAQASLSVGGKFRLHSN